MIFYIQIYDLAPLFFCRIVLFRASSNTCPTPTENTDSSRFIECFGKITNSLITLNMCLLKDMNFLEI